MDQLKDLFSISAVIEDDHVVYRDYVDISVAVATPKVNLSKLFLER